MVGTLSIKVNAAKPECPLPPCFTIKGSPSSIRIMDVPRAIGEWNITTVKLVMKYPNNTTVAKEAVRVGNVWVATVEGCQTVGKVSNGYEIMADGKDEDGNPVEGYVLGRGALLVLDDDTDIARMVGKTTMRYLDDIPSAPTKGDVLVIDEELKIYDGEEWVTISGGNDDTYTKAEIDEKVDEIDSSISALGDEIPTKTSDLENDSGYITSADIPPIPTKTSDLTNDSGFLTSTSSTITELESSMSQLESSMSELDSTVSELDGQAVKYATSEKVNVVLNSQGHPMTLQINDAANVGDSRVIFGSTNRNHISKNSLTIGVPENGETAQHMGDTHVQIGGTQNDAYVLIGQGVTLFSSKEKGKTKMFMDDDRIFVTTPATVEEGQTLKAIKVANETAMSGRSAKKVGEMTKRDEPSLRDEPQDWHWEYVSADLPSKTSDLTNDSGFITEDDVADKRDYDDLTYGGIYDPTDAEGYYGITSWTIEGYKYNGQTLPAFNTATRDKNNPTYGTYWNNGGQVIYTSDFSTFNLEGFGNAEPVPFTLSLDKTTYEVSFMGTEQQNLTLTANLANADRLALNSQLAPITASVSALASSMTAVASSVEANASAIQANASAIQANASAMGELTQSVSANTSAIQTNASAIELTNSHVSALESRMGEVSASVSALGSSVNVLTSSVEALGSSVSDMGSQVSAMASSISAKRDYLDLTYSTTVPSETIDNSKLVWEDQDPLYNAKLTFVVNDSEAGEEHLAWNDGETCWIDSAMQNFMVWYAHEYGYDPADGKFVLVDGADVCLQFNLQDGVNVQTFNYTSQNLSSTGTLTMTFTGEPAHQVNDTIALNGEVSSAISSITTTLSSYATISYVDAQIGAMLSSQL